MSPTKSAVKATSRSERWNEATAAYPGLPSLRPTELSLSELERAEAAIQLALGASKSTQAKLKQLRHRRQGAACLQALAGMLGVAGFVTMLCVGSLTNSTILAWLSAFLCAVPIFASAQRAIFRDVQELSMVAAIEHARAGVVHAREIRDVIRQALQNEKSNSVAKHILSSVVSQMEQTVAAGPGRENRRDGEVGAQSRRHNRIKPVNSRIIIKRSDDVAMLAEVIDVSISGAAVTGDLPGIAVGDEVVLGSKAARVVREIPNGCACEFVVPLEPQELNFEIVL